MTRKQLKNLKTPRCKSDTFLKNDTSNPVFTSSVIVLPGAVIPKISPSGFLRMGVAIRRAGSPAHPQLRAC